MPVLWLLRLFPVPDSIALMFQLIDTSLYSHEDFHVNLQISDSIILTFRMVNQEWLR